MFHRTTLATALLLAFAVSAGAQEAPPAAPKPTVQRYPPRAMDLGKEGATIMDCAITPEHTLTDCVLIAEDPKGFDFGQTALNMAVLFHITNGDGSKRIKVPITFRLYAGAPGRAAWQAHLNFKSQPTNADEERVRPPKLDGPGAVVLRCHVRPVGSPEGEAGSLYGCTPTEEKPGNLGLAQAALSLAPIVRFNPKDLMAGDPDWTVDVDITWAAKPAG